MKTIWKSCYSIPNEGSRIIIEHIYWYNLFKESSIEIAVVNDIHNVALNYPSSIDWFDWQPYIKRWCYVNDILKLK